MGIDPGPQGYGVVHGRCAPGSALAPADFQNLTSRFHNSASQCMNFCRGHPSKGVWGTMFGEGFERAVGIGGGLGPIANLARKGVFPPQAVSTRLGCVRMDAQRHVHALPVIPGIVLGKF